MGRYNFERLGPDRFEAMVKALLDAKLRLSGNVIQFGDGRDGGREATWSQPPNHPDWRQPERQEDSHNIPCEWVFQVKFHSLDTKRDLVTVLGQDLRSELKKIKEKHRLVCDHYVLITNVPLTGVRRAGGRDRLQEYINEWGRPLWAEVWDANDITAMLDSHPGVRQTYLEDILPSDILAAVLNQFDGPRARIQQQLRAYLHSLVAPRGGTATATTSEAGDLSDTDLALKDVYVDLMLKPQNVPAEIIEGISGVVGKTKRTRDMSSLPASLALLLSPHAANLLLAGPGYGKSTLCKFIALAHAVQCLAPDPSLEIAKVLPLDRLGVQGQEGVARLLMACTPRVPFRIELRRFADWRRKNAATEGTTGIAAYIALELINRSVEGSLTADDVYDLATRNPTLLILDGLDEVPFPEDRKAILDGTEVFQRRVRAEPGADLQLLLSSRPQGYNADFGGFVPHEWQIEDLEEKAFLSYCDAWLSKRVNDAQERQDARQRIEQGLQAPLVRNLATTLLHATAMLTLAKARRDIPHHRTELFSKLVDVIFERERNKSEHVRNHELALRALHDRIAYEIHCQMESGRADTLTENKFRELANATWVSVCGDELTTCKAKEVVEDIIRAAKDRLVFLHGQGSEQSEIGFLLASYREYFAAKYLDRHERADPGRVFNALVKREAHWANVLRFYVGFQTPAVQRQFVDEMTEPLSEVHAPRGIIDLVRRRRMLLRLLPELKDLPLKSFNEALDEALADDTLWTWNRMGLDLDLLRGIRDGQALDRAIDHVKPHLKSDDQHQLNVALFIVAGLIEYAPAKQRDECVRILGDRMQEPAVRSRIARTAIQANLGELIRSLRFDDLRAALPGLRFSPVTRKRLLENHLPPDMLAALKLSPFLFSPWHGHWSWSEPQQHLYWPADIEIDLGKHASALQVWLNGCLFDVDLRIQNVPNEDRAKLPADLQELWAALDTALACPGDAGAHRRVETMDAAFGHKDYGVLLRGAARKMLDPSPTAFGSDKEYREHWKWRAKLRSTQMQDEVISLLRPTADEHFATGQSESWLCGFVLPRRWDDLVAQRLVSEAAVKNLRNSALAHVIETCPTTLSVLTNLSFQEDEPSVDAQIPKGLAEIFAKDPGALSYVAHTLLHPSHWNATDADIPVMEKAIQTVLAEPSIAGEWRAFFCGMVAKHFPTKLEWLVQLWTPEAAALVHYVLFYGLPKPDLLDRLASANLPHADDVLIDLASISDQHDESVALSNNVRAALLRLAQPGIKPAKRKAATLALFFRRSADVGVDANVWLRPDLWQGPDSLARFSPLWGEKIQQTCPQPHLEPMLETLIRDRANYPTEMVAAAVNRYAALLSAPSSELRDADWQRPRKAADRRC